MILNFTKYIFIHKYNCEFGIRSIQIFKNIFEKTIYNLWDISTMVKISRLEKIIKLSPFYGNTGVRFIKQFF